MTSLVTIVPPAPKSTRPRLNLALQGGGAHGAYTWGVLDRVLEEDRFEIGWISGTSAGAINAAALASGLAREGVEGARQALSGLWQAVASGGLPDLVRFNPILAGSLASLGRSSAFAHMASYFSPYDFNPLGLDPFRHLLAAHIDVDLIRRVPGPELLVTATHVATARARTFRRAELTLEALLASACLPTLHHAVIIDGEAYWDGGFSSNPDLMTLATQSPVADTLIVQLDPMVRTGLPSSAKDIAMQMTYLAFHRPYVAELEAIVRHQEHARRRWPDVARLFGRETGPSRRIAEHRFHLIEAGRATAALSPESRGRPEQALISYLFQAGRADAQFWLERHGDAVGHADTADLAGRLAALLSSPSAVAIVAA